MGTGASTTTPWLAEIASASAVVAASRLGGFTPPIGRMRGVSTAKAAAGDAALPATKPQKRSDPRGPGPPPTVDFRHEPIAGARPFGESGDEARGNDHQSGRIHGPGEADAKSLAEKANGETRGQTKS